MDKPDVYGYYCSMSRNTREVANVVAKRLREEMNPSSILLFGSTARGANAEGSDLDLCLLFDTLPDRKLEIMRTARRISRSVYKGAMDIIAYSNEEWEAYIASGSSFELKLKREAISL